MNSLRKTFLLLSILMLCFRGSAETNSIETLDLKAFVGKSQFTRLEIEWMFPHGRQVADGIPFQMDGVVELYGKSALQSNLDIRTNVNGIRVGKAFEEIHLLCSSTGGSPTGKTSIATVVLNYDDGSSNRLEIIFGTHIRQWWGPRHEEDTPLLDSRAKPAWSMEVPEAAAADKRSRFFHTVLMNPMPGKVVKTIDLASTKTVAGTLIAGISVGPKNVPPLLDTLPNIPPDSDKFVRTGELVSITGKIFDPDLQPLTNALVRIGSARQIKAYQDSMEAPGVGLEARTDAEGQFRFSRIPDDQLYQLQVLPAPFSPFLFLNVDPKRGPVQIRVKVATPLVPKQKFFVHGKVVNPEGKPVAGATIETEGVALGQGRKSFGGNNGFADMVITDWQGEFLLERAELFTAVRLNIRGFALANARPWIDATNTLQIVKLGVGAEMVGRLVKDGKPLPHLGITISCQDGNAEVYMGDYTATTDEEGRFVFKHLPPDTGWFLHGDIHTLKDLGALHPRAVRSGDDGDRKDLGDLEIESGLTLSGTVRARTGQTLPQKGEIHIRLERGGNDIVAIDEKGNFEFRGLSPGLATVSVVLSGWNLTPANRSLDQWSSGSLNGLLEKSKTDLLVMVEKKARANNYDRWNGNGFQLPEDEPHQRPLMGAEDSGPPWIRFAGTVVDDDTGKPIREFTITPGRKPPTAQSAATKTIAARLVESIRGKTVPPHERTFWDYGRAESFTNGSFSVAMMPLKGIPTLRIEAENFAAWETEAMPTSDKNLVIRLKKGEGANGSVVLPDGKPADGATVIFAKTQQSFPLRGTELSGSGERTQLQKTTANGLFTFPLQAEGERLLVSHTNGWANVPLSRFSNGDKVQLQPWAAVSGTLVDAKGKPVPNETLWLIAHENSNRGEARVNYQMQPLTDAKGYFFFSYVPSQAMDLYRLVPSGRVGSMNLHLQTRLIVEAGKTNNLGSIILDTPPPLSAFEELRQKLGF
jgi:uncharacterized GH25 family protein